MQCAGSSSPDALNILYPSPPMTRSSSRSPPSRSKPHLQALPSYSTSASPSSSQRSHPPALPRPETRHARLQPSPPSGFAVSVYDPPHHPGPAAASRANAATAAPTSSGKPLVSCEPCKKAHLRCEAKRPCDRCVRSGKESRCVDVIHKDRGRPPKDPKKIEARAAAREAIERRQAERTAAMQPIPTQFGQRLRPGPPPDSLPQQPSPTSQSPASTRPATSHAAYGVTHYRPPTASAYVPLRGPVEQSTYAFAPTLPAPSPSFVPPLDLPPFTRSAASDPTPMTATMRAAAPLVQAPPRETYDVQSRPYMTTLEPQQRVDPSRDLRGIHLSRPPRQVPLSVQIRAQDESLRLPPLRSPTAWESQARDSPANYLNSPISQQAPYSTRPSLSRTSTNPLPSAHEPNYQSPSLAMQRPPQSRAHPSERPETYARPRRQSEHFSPGRTHANYQYTHSRAEHLAPRAPPSAYPQRFVPHSQAADPETLPSPSNRTIRDRESSGSRSAGDSSDGRRTGTGTGTGRERTEKKRRRIELSDIVT